MGADDECPDRHISTIGVDFKIRNIKMDDSKVAKLQVWDTAGQERFRAVTQSFYRNAHGVMVVFDLNSLDSFRNVKTWLVGTKCDLPHRVPHEEVQAFADSLHIPYIQTSATSSLQVEEAFFRLADILRKQAAVTPLQPAERVVKRRFALHAPLRKEPGCEPGCCTIS